MDVYLLFRINLLISISIILCKEIPRLYPFNIKSDIKVGQKVILQCISMQGTPPIEYEWYHNGSKIENGNGFLLEYYPALNSKALIIESASLESNGNYTCLARNAYGSDEITNYIEIKGPSYWIEKPENDPLIILGESITLKCNVGGFPKPKVDWFKITSGSNLWLGEGISYQINSTTKKSGGIYQCKASNGIGSSIEHSFNLRVSVWLRYSIFSGLF